MSESGEAVRFLRLEWLHKLGCRNRSSILTGTGAVYLLVSCHKQKTKGMHSLQVVGAFASILSFLLAVYFQVGAENSLGRNLSLAVAIALLIGAVLLKRLIPPDGDMRGKAPRITRLSDSLQIPISIGRTYEVFYPRKFKSPPNLQVRCVRGGVEFEFLEQRHDGFIMRTIGSSSWGSGSADSGITIEWQADGELA